jgi:hypothetical protein
MRAWPFQKPRPTKRPWASCTSTTLPGGRRCSGLRTCADQIHGCPGARSVASRITGGEAGGVSIAGMIAPVFNAA